jgi:hypothetical protein
VLLKNNRQTLPLKAGSKIAVVGPHANASRFLIQVDTGKICGADGTFDCVESPYEAVKRLNVGGTTSMAVGCDIIDASPKVSTPELKAAAVTLAKSADVVILAIGIGQCGCMGIADTYMVNCERTKLPPALACLPLCLGSWTCIGYLACECVCVLTLGLCVTYL